MSKAGERIRTGLREAIAHAKADASAGQLSAPRIVNCPTCGKPVPWVPESAFRPFCSERCRNIDLGAWATEDYRVPEQEQPLPDDQQ